MSRWTDPHPYQNDRQPRRDEISGRVHHAPASDARAICRTCSAEVSFTLHGGDCQACAEDRVLAIQNALSP